MNGMNGIKSVSLHEAGQMLSFIPSGVSREEWLKILMALKSEFGDDAKQIAKDWSESGDGFKPKSFDADWKAIKHVHSITIGTLVFQALNAGFKFDNNLEKPTFKPISQEEKQKRRDAELAELQKEWALNAVRIKEIMAGSSAISSLSAYPVLSYLGKRGINLDLNDLPKGVGFHPDLKSFEDGKLEGTFPTMIGKLTDENGQTVTLNRTYLTQDGVKAPTEKNKKFCSPKGEITGASIKMYEPVNGLLAVAEGIETALAVRSATGYPVWATCTANNLSKLDIKGGVHTLVIFADKDVSGAGKKAANDLRIRMEKQGIKVAIFYPPSGIPEGEKGIDWLDELSLNGAKSFTKTLLRGVA